VVIKQEKGQIIGIYHLPINVFQGLDLEALRLNIRRPKLSVSTGPWNCQWLQVTTRLITDEAFSVRCILGYTCNGQLCWAVISFSDFKEESTCQTSTHTNTQ